MVITIYCIQLVADPGLIRGEYANPCWDAPTCYLAKEIAENSMKMKEIGWGRVSLAPTPWICQCQPQLQPGTLLYGFYEILLTFSRSVVFDLSWDFLHHVQECR